MNIRFGQRGVSIDQNEVPEPLDDMPLKLLENPVAIQQAKECAMSAINDGYTHLVYNFIRNGQS